MNKIMSLISRTEHLMQLPVVMSKNTFRVVKSRIGIHNFRHNNIQILNFNFKILSSKFFLPLRKLHIFVDFKETAEVSQELSTYTS